MDRRSWVRRSELDYFPSAACAFLFALGPERILACGTTDNSVRLAWELRLQERNITSDFVVENAQPLRGQESGGVNSRSN